MNSNQWRAIAIAKLEKLSVKDGDTIVVRDPKREMGEDMLAHLASGLSEYFPRCTSLYLGGDETIEVQDEKAMESFGWVKLKHGNAILE